MRFRLLDKRTAGDAIRLGIFMTITALATAMLAVTIGNISFGDKRSFTALFSDATGVTNGDDIRVAGVKVGSVTDVSIANDSQAMVTFKVDDDVAVTESTNLTIKYRNLVGQRYISLTPGLGSNDPQAEDSTIPMGRTAPALDLSVLFDGFKPLFQALSPNDVNKLAFELIQVFQGEGGTLDSLLRRTASVTTTLADRDDVIGDLITNLNQTLVILGDRDDELSDLVGQLRTFVGGLSKDRNAILGSLEEISNLSVEAADLVTGIRPGLAEDVRQLRRLATTLNKPANKTELNRALGVLPIKLEKVGRTAIYGSWFNFYLCDFKARVTLAEGITLPVDFEVGGRCNA